MKHRKIAGQWRCANKTLDIWVRDSQVPDKDAARARSFRWVAYPAYGVMNMGDSASLQESMKTADDCLRAAGWTLEPVGNDQIKAYVLAADDETFIDVEFDPELWHDSVMVCMPSTSDVIPWYIKDISDDAITMPAEKRMVRKAHIYKGGFAGNGVVVYGPLDVVKPRMKVAEAVFGFFLWLMGFGWSR